MSLCKALFHVQKFLELNITCLSLDEKSNINQSFSLKLAHIGRFLLRKVLQILEELCSVSTFENFCKFLTFVGVYDINLQNTRCISNLPT